MFSKLILLAPLFSLALASPTPVELNSRASIDTSSHCGQWDTVTASQYSLLLDLWGESGATSGSQCANLMSLSGSTISWKTTWTWTGGSGVKSFTNMQLNQGLNQQLSAISSMPVRFPSRMYTNIKSIEIVSHIIDYVDMVSEHFGYYRCRCCVRFIHVKHGRGLERERNHDLARQLQRRSHLLQLQLERPASAH